jgi:hypothetical protein
MCFVALSSHGEGTTETKTMNYNINGMVLKTSLHPKKSEKKVRDEIIACLIASLLALSSLSVPAF